MLGFGLPALCMGSNALLGVLIAADLTAMVALIAEELALREM